MLHQHRSPAISLRRSCLLSRACQRAAVHSRALLVLAFPQPQHNYLAALQLHTVSMTPEGLLARCRSDAHLLLGYAAPTQGFSKSPSFAVMCLSVGSRVQQHLPCSCTWSRCLLMACLPGVAEKHTCRWAALHRHRSPASLPCRSRLLSHIFQRATAHSNMQQAGCLAAALSSAGLLARCRREAHLSLGCAAVAVVCLLICSSGGHNTTIT